MAPFAQARRKELDAIVVTLDTTILGWRTRDLDLGWLPFLRGMGIAQYTSDPVFTRLLSEPLDSSQPEPRRNLAALRVLIQIGRNYPGPFLEVLRSGQLSLGPRVPAFEEAFARRLGAAHASAVSSGTAGLHLALRAAGVSDGDEVVTSPFSFVASANVCVFERARPVFADIDPVTLNLDPAAAAAAVTARTSAGGAAPSASGAGR